MSCGVGRRYGSDLALLWLWCRSAATAPIRPLAWESPCAAGAAVEKAKRQNNNNNNNKINTDVDDEEHIQSTVEKGQRFQDNRRERFSG